MLEKREGELEREPFWEPLVEAGAKMNPLAEVEAEPETLLLLLKDIFYISIFEKLVWYELNRINVSATSSEQMNSTSYKLH